MLDGDGNGRMADEVDDPVAAGRRGGSHKLPIESKRSDLDGATPDTVTVWGIPVRTLPSGRRAWPDVVREMATAKVLAGAPTSLIAKEIGTSNSVVADWVKRARIAAPAAAFVEVLRPDPDKAPARGAGKSTVPADRVIPPTGPALAPECRIRIGDADITIPPGYPGTHLAEVLRAVRASQ